MTKIGLLGGTFNPPHTAHLVIAQEALMTLGLSEVWFIPVHTPPHKTREQMASPEERFIMTQKATQHNDKFNVSDIELTRKGPSYTIETVKTLKKQTTDTEFYFIIGGDMAEQLDRWKDIHELKSMVTFVIADRPGFSSHSAHRENESVHVHVPQMDISSTMIRKRYAAGKNIRYYVADEVWRFIKERDLYG
ncbi:nicotinate-nucleotide adenylyltransferase [Alteribacillus persepolensis]|uniref:Probable nicotinate-nucleotide adenylyltransferase n=1 Tax=Alteribacillus persepolensis TaxID=568899 RepID=A0A1G8CMZ7_9BACI|nr:nicotinate-nucleotide adenylyltransferase [Alteribacillus persepolensis]SDH46754.1 nicotinate-nucleotide adenylyltransferase [Alteribacillus persepolensis]